MWPVKNISHEQFFLYVYDVARLTKIMISWILT